MDFTLEGTHVTMSRAVSEILQMAKGHRLRRQDGRICSMGATGGEAPPLLYRITSVQSWRNEPPVLSTSW